MVIRMDVFVDEQNVPTEEEADGHDETARHFLAWADGAAAGTARVVFLSPDLAKITRVAVRAAYRGQGIGLALMRYILATIPVPDFVLDAQVQAQGFYAGLGFTPEGEVFMEAGIAHQRMRRAVGARY